MISRRTFMAAVGAVSAVPQFFSVLKAEVAAAKPISVGERQTRIAKLQRLMLDRKVGALLVEPGSTLDYFTGIRWHRSERTTAAIIPARGEAVVITPAFEEPSVRETLQIGGEVRAWNEADSPFERLVQALRDRGVHEGSVAVESTTRFFIVDGIRQLSPRYQFIAADSLVGACRLIKSPTELALMQLANNVTMAAMTKVHARVSLGMNSDEIAALMNEETAVLGGLPEFSLVLLNEASAYPHGSRQAQTVREGSIVLMDCGCSVQGYQSDISRTWVHGSATRHQRKVWETVKRGQELALETAKIGIPTGHLDDVVRAYYEREGWGRHYQLPGLPHRTGHGIGMDGHESAYLVHGDTTALQVGMCFSDEPGLYIPGEFGVRLEDCWYMSAAGPVTFTALADSIDRPMGVKITAKSNKEAVA